MAQKQRPRLDLRRVLGQKVLQQVKRRSEGKDSGGSAPEQQASQTVQTEAQRTATTAGTKWVNWSFRTTGANLVKLRKVRQKKRAELENARMANRKEAIAGEPPLHDLHSSPDTGKVTEEVRRGKTYESVRLRNEKQRSQLHNRQPISSSVRQRQRDALRGRRFQKTKKQIDAILKQKRRLAVARQQQKVSIKAGRRGVRGTVRVVKSSIKAALAAARAIIAIVAAGGVGLICVLLVAATIAVLAASGFGLFLSDNIGSMTIQSAIASINQEYVQRLNDLQAENQPYDSVAVYGSKPPWKEVLAVYAVLCTNDTENPMDVATMDEEHLKRLSTVFWDMTSLSASKSQSTQMEQVEVDVIDEETGQPTGETTTEYQEVTTTLLKITVTAKTADDMMSALYVTDHMRTQLTELLSEENNDLWAELLGGGSGSAGSLEGDEATVASYLLGLGFTTEATAAILGNIKAECGWNYSTIGVLDGLYHPYERNIGIFQFTTTSSDPNSNDEYWRFMRWCEANGLFYGDLDAQLRWAFSNEPGTSYWAGRWTNRGRYYSNAPGFTEEIYENRNVTADSFLAETNVGYATYSWMAYYEGCTNGTGSHLDLRLAYAYEYYDQLITASAVTLIWPTTSTTISSYFGPRESPGGIGSTDHKGIDIAAEQGTPIFAAASGTVTLASYSESAGNWIRIDHGNGVCTTYMHCSELYVTRGQQVAQGETIAAVGSTGHSTGPHLDFRVEVDGVHKNPLDFVSPG